jgi:hypothetical protein
MSKGKQTGGRAPRQPTLDEVGRRSDRLLYEVLMLRNTATLLEHGIESHQGWRELTESIAVVESFLTQTRSLLGFLYPPKRVIAGKRRKRGEVFAMDYCAAGWRAPRWAGARSVRAAAGRDIARLSIDQLPRTGTGEYAGIVSTILGAIALFLADADGLSEHTRSHLRDALQHDRARPQATAAAVAPTVAASVPPATAPAKAPHTVEGAIPIATAPVRHRAPGAHVREGPVSGRLAKPVPGGPVATPATAPVSAAGASTQAAEQSQPRTAS